MNSKELTNFLADIGKSNKLIIVEGIKDKKALNNLGIANYIVILKKPIYQVIEDIAKITDEAVILTDFDKKGKELYGKLNTGLQKFGVKVDHYYREWLQCNTKLSHIEGLRHYLGKLESKKESRPVLNA
ncbi:MAG: hypothetical protein ABIC04_07400 [Nanoarchaeota archaeon]